MNKKGFSLLEVVIGIAILGLIGSFLGGILTRVYKGNSKTTLVGNIKQNGQTALNTLDTAIRNAETVVCPLNSSLSDVIVLQDKGGNYIRFKYYPQPANNLYNGFIEQDMLTLSDPNQALTLCSAPNQAPFSITDQNTKSGVSVLSGSFQVNKIRGLKDVVSISFQIGSPVAGGSGFENTIEGNSIGFQTSVQIR
ncbi:MAG: hypothetical protein ACD_30C00112G0039 [uncultured bacterium]|uniref:Uncharacterized protein n=4 Tax=Candidatus Daviesiibacteriota TaxID=1752718 RepID=A0A0G0I359_9BACT|nr:MAG: hypothetical protein ACD_30C00112G0039 [uncultured bacterium]KKQ10541.1 MAG: hypothetical protein US19_C0003G0036 [Candidatus Daviesbacteria bacterium GW2011_GWB1_36_5]KKQ15284.1 MAG: hypothetical protein US28_C0019G0017 [Candidatus Daviesbacteria bacterium GW2011_GWA1_36_8]OGE17198.1 MAG: hypothetical protein A2858_00645 [Candidatus Daviesbacteria bacterium RIFCSPHIGHO2_01_FULL_36_37]OGE35979.1 MAG: hypothetical protein A3E66_01640 [Candidatus Daviesbacteria bacterium RIFCSPHIGHO2_12_F